MTLTRRYFIVLMILLGVHTILAGYESTSIDLTSSQGHSLMRQMALTAGY